MQERGVGGSQVLPYARCPRAQGRSLKGRSELLSRRSGGTSGNSSCPCFRFQTAQPFGHPLDGRVRSHADQRQGGRPQLPVARFVRPVGQ
jgi:hypothetical protein